MSALESRRRRVLEYAAALTMFAFAMVAFSFAVIYFGRGMIQDNSLYLALSIVPPIFALSLWALGYSYLTRRYVKEFKSDVMSKMVKFIDEGLEFSKERHISEEQFIGSKIFLERPDRYRGEDCVFGTVGETAVEFSEVNAEYRTETKDSQGQRRTEWHTIFKGVFFVADFNKEFNGITLVLPDTAERLFGQVLGSMLQKHTPGRPPLVKLEDPEFERHFAVYGDDQVVARYILSPSLMERMVAFKKSTGRDVFFSFVMSSVMAAIPDQRNLFEPRLFRTMLDYEELAGHFRNLELVIGIVDELSLNTRIWSKQ